VEKVLGKGSFGKVLLVTKKDTKKTYAMKILKKEMIEKRNQRIHTQNEREIMEGTRDHPFIVQLRFAFQTADKLYMVMDFMPGGELFFHLRRAGRFTEDRSRFYIAEILTALDYVHGNGIIYRDLKPENALLDEDGHVCIADFGLSKTGLIGNSGEKAFTFCGTPEYLAPEIIKGIGHDKAVDYWSLGALLYEMLSGAPPFYSKNREEMFKNILNKPVEMKPYFSEAASDILKNLLQIDPLKRLSDGVTARAHPFFKSIDFVALEKR
jgi:serine/threonine protein kinase